MDFEAWREALKRKTEAQKRGLSFGMFVKAMSENHEKIKTEKNGRRGTKTACLATTPRRRGCGRGTWDPCGAGLVAGGGGVAEVQVAQVADG